MCKAEVRFPPAASSAVATGLRLTIASLALSALPFAPGALAQQSLNEAARQISPTAAPALKSPAVRLIDPTRVIVTLKPGSSHESLVTEMNRRKESAGGALDQATAAVAAMRRQAGQSFVLPLTAGQREANIAVRPVAVAATGGDFSAALDARASQMVEALRRMPEVAAVEPSVMWFATQANPADAMNALIEGSATPRSGRAIADTPNSGSIDATFGAPPARNPAPVLAAPAQTLPDDPLLPFQWALKTNASAISASGLPGGTGFIAHAGLGGPANQPAPVVAIIDTGLVGSHQDLATGEVLPGYDFITLPFVANDGDGRDADASDPGDGPAANDCGEGTPARPSTFHGSHVAGIAGAVATGNSVGIAGPGLVRILPVRVLGKCGGFDSDITDAVRWAAGLPVDGVPLNPNPARILNMSLGGPGPCSLAFQAAVNEVLAMGAVIIVAAGNDGVDATTQAPANCSGVITVAASDARGVITPYSNFGPRVDILAPGGDNSRDDDGNGRPDGILSMVDGGYEFKEGTSMATPLVSAAAAIVAAERPDATAEEVKSILTAAALPRDASQCPKGCGAGLLQFTAPAQSAATAVVRR